MKKLSYKKLKEIEEQKEREKGMKMEMKERGFHNETIDDLVSYLNDDGKEKKSFWTHTMVEKKD